MTRRRYLLHLTLDTGHQRRSYRDEVADDVIAILRPLLVRASTGAVVPIPGVDPPCTVRGITSRGGGLLLRVEAADAVPLASIGIAGTSLASACLWREWITDGEPPRPPWCVVRLLPGLAAHPEAASWLGDFERCAAWAWID